MIKTKLFAMDIHQPKYPQPEKDPSSAFETAPILEAPGTQDFKDAAEDLVMSGALDDHTVYVEGRTIIGFPHEKDEDPEEPKVRTIRVSYEIDRPEDLGEEDESPEDDPERHVFIFEPSFGARSKDAILEEFKAELVGKITEVEAPPAPMPRYGEIPKVEMEPGDPEHGVYLQDDADQVCREPGFEGFSIQVLGTKELMRVEDAFSFEVQFKVNNYPVESFVQMARTDMTPQEIAYVFQKNLRETLRHYKDVMEEQIRESGERDRLMQKNIDDLGRNYRMEILRSRGRLLADALDVSRDDLRGPGKKRNLDVTVTPHYEIDEDTGEVSHLMDVTVSVPNSNYKVTAENLDFPRSREELDLRPVFETIDDSKVVLAARTGDKSKRSQEAAPVDPEKQRRVAEKFKKLELKLRYGKLTEKQGRRLFDLYSQMDDSSKKRYGKDAGRVFAQLNWNIDEDSYLA